MATFKPPVGVDRMERVTKRAALAPGMRRWLRFDKSGASTMVSADKHAIAQQTGVQASMAHRLSMNMQPISYCIISLVATPRCSATARVGVRLRGRVKQDARHESKSSFCIILSATFKCAGCAAAGPAVAGEGAWLSNRCPAA